MMKRIGQLCNSPIYYTLFVAIAVAPLLSLGIYVFQKERSIQELRSELAQLENKATKSLNKRVLSKKFRDQYQNANPYFLSQVVGTIELLGKERALVKKIASHSIFCANSEVRKREQFFNKNNIHFCEKEVRMGKNVRETEEAQSHKVEVAIDDIEEFLVQVEGIKIDIKKPKPERPQIIIKEFTLENIGNSYLLNSTLIKREFTNSKRS